ncbi:MAG: DUF2970 domain-containing protein [Proteobacteria bacterium]|nr:DUF2970 domain-containing protein [Pseudomonadota bacterium]
MKIGIFFRAVLAVLSGFIGIRKRQSADDDMRSIHPLHIIVAGVCMLLLFITLVLFVVKLTLS